MSMETIYDVLTGLEKMGQVTDIEMERQEGIVEICKEEEKGMEVELEQIRFTYPGGDYEIITDLDLHVTPGESVVVCGHNGSGKSTLLQILAALYDVTHGQVIYNGLPKGNLDLISLRSSIGDCLAHEQLFDGTVLENITMGRERATFDNVKWAVHSLGLDRFINSLPNGYETVLDPQGKKLPKSTIQKLLLVRAVADRPKLLLLEDALEHLDDEDRKQAVDFLLEKEQGWTLVAVSADNYLRSKADRVYLMEGGCFKNWENT